MNKRTIFAVALLSSFGALQASKTILVPRSISTDPMYELALNFHQEYMRDKADEDSFSWSIYATPFYQSSARAKKISGYLLPTCCSNCCGSSCGSCGTNSCGSCCSTNCGSCCGSSCCSSSCCDKTCITVREDGLGDIGSPWLYLLAAEGSQFNSTMTFCPKWYKAGAHFNLRFNFANIARGLWLSAIIVPLQSTHKLKMCESQCGAAGSLSGYTTICDALNSYGVQRFCNKVSKGGVDDIQLKLGYTLEPREKWLVELYLAGVIPTSNTQKACYFFEPQVGSGRHGAFGAGFDGVIHITEKESSAWDFIFDVKYLYYFQHCQIRSFDLCNGDWSRYLLGTFTDSRTVGVPLLPCLTRSCNVTPRSQVSLYGVFHYEYENWEFELGGNFWWRQSEDVSLCNTCLNNVAIYDLAGARLGNPISASNANISQSAGGTNAAPSDTTFTVINPCNINACSAAQPNAYTFKVFGALGYEFKEHDWPWLLGIGGFYEAANSCSALNQWAAWLKVGIHF